VSIDCHSACIERRLCLSSRSRVTSANATSSITSIMSSPSVSIGLVRSCRAHCPSVCHSDGVVLIDPEYVKDRKVYASVFAGSLPLPLSCRDETRRNDGTHGLFSVSCSVSIWPRRSRRSRAHLSQGFVLFDATNLSANRRSQTTVDALAATATAQIGRQCVSVLLSGTCTSTGRTTSDCRTNESPL
jgi:hypothetical protein